MVPEMSATPPEQQDPAAPQEPPAAPPALPPPPRCKDCGSLLTGRYCAECGQPAATQVLTMHDVAHDVVHSALHLDSRVWRTLRTLVLKPGELTKEFIRGRRQRYLPPFRLYLIISVAFFAVSSLLPEGGFLTITDDPADVRAPIIIGDSPPAEDPGRAAPDAAATPGDPSGRAAPRMVAIEAPGTCSLQTGWDWLDERAPEACRKVAEDRGERLRTLFMATAPKLMFVFLPVMAAVAMLFYWKPRRLYAEHLVTFLHVHAFVFLYLSVTTLLGPLTRPDVPGGSLLGLVTLALTGYLAWYVFRAMRVVYGEGRLRTGLKFTALSCIYFVLLGTTMLGGVLYSAMTL